MQAYVLRDIGKFELEEVEPPVPGKDEVIVRVKAAGICGSDIPRIYHHGTYSYPLIPGHEYSGIVVETGYTASSEVGQAASDDEEESKCGNSAASWIGKRVGIFPLIPCGECGPCRQKKYEMCRRYSYLGSRRNGGFAEYVSVPVWNLVELPEEVTFEQAAMMEPMAVAVHAMRKALQEDLACVEAVSHTEETLQADEAANKDIKASKNDIKMSKNDIKTLKKDIQSGVNIKNSKDLQRIIEKLNLNIRIAICGAGTVGLFLLMFLKEAGYEDILIIGNKDIQREKALALGISKEQFYDNRDGEADVWLEQCAQEKDIDVFFECVGANETVKLAVDHTAPGGRVMLVGNPASDMVLERQTYWKILRNQLTLFGTWNSSYHRPLYDGASDRLTQDDYIPEDDWQYVLERLAAGRVHPEQMITHRYDLEGLIKGFELMRDKTEEYLKIMFRS